MTNHWYDADADRTRCGEYRGRLAFAVSANYAVSCRDCRDQLDADEREDQKYPFDGIPPNLSGNHLDKMSGSS